MKKLFLFGLLFSSIAVFADTPPITNVYKLNAPGGNGLIVSTSGKPALVTTTTPGYVATWNGTTVDFEAGGGGGGGVSSVGLVLPSSVFTVSGSPVTSSGTLTGSFATQAANACFMGPVSGSPATPSFRAMAATDIPALPASKITSGQGSLTTSTAGVTVTGTNAGLAPLTVDVQTASGSQPGLLSSSDWTAFNGKQSSLSFSSPLVNILGTVSCNAASGSQPGCLSSTDWTTFNNKGSGTVTALSVASSNGFAGSSSGGATPIITVSTTVNGIMKGNGTAASAATSGTDYAPGTAGNATGIVKSTTSTGALTTAIAADFPTLNQNTSGNAATVTTNANLTGPITSVGNATSIASQTGTGTTFAMSVSPVFTTPNIGTATGSASLNALKSGDTFTGAVIDSFAGTASTPALSITGAPYTGGSTTTNKPQLLVENAGTSTAWGSAGTYFGVNGSSGFTGNLLDFQLNGSPRTKLDYHGQLTVRGDLDSTGSTLYLPRPSSGSAGVTITTGYGAVPSFAFGQGGTVFFEYAINTAYLGLGYSIPDPKYPFHFMNSTANTTPLTNLTYGGTDLYPVLMTQNTNSTAGNYGGIANSGSSHNFNGYLLWYNDTQTSTSEDSHAAIATAAAGTRSEKLKISKTGEISFGGATAAVSSCGTNPTIAGNNVSGVVTVGTGGVATACTITFTEAYANNPHCFANDESEIKTVQVVPSSASVIVLNVSSAFSAGSVIDYHCVGHF